ncbi:MAG TPA: peptidylprolyl isomerase [Stellaceae bacterium]
MLRFRAFCLASVALVLVAGVTAEAARRAPQSAAATTRQPAPSQPGGGSPEMRIAAVVNDDVISVFDLFSRVRMVLISSNLPDTEETRQKLAGQVLKQLIDEKLQLQEAKKQNITATEDEVNRALGQIEKQNNMKPGQLEQYLQARGIERDVLVTQLTAAIVWAKLVKRLASQTTEISDEEIDEALKQAKEHANEPQSRVAEIFLAVDNPSQEDEVKHRAEQLSQQMRQGARFSAIAQQFSQSATAAVGGDMGWVRPEQLSPELGKVAAQLKIGELSQPIRSGGGFYLLVVLDRRTGTTGSDQGPVYDLVQVVFPLPAQTSEATKRAAIGELQNIRNAAKDCPSLLKIGKEKAPQLSSEGRLTAAEMTPEMRGLVNRLAIGQVSPTIVQKNGVGIVMICSKTEAKAGKGPTREEISESILRQRLDNVARRYLRDLRRNAYVDVRV